METYIKIRSHMKLDVPQGNLYFKKGEVMTALALEEDRALIDTWAGQVWIDSKYYSIKR